MIFLRAVACCVVNVVAHLHLSLNLMSKAKMSTSSVSVLRLCSISGYDGRINDIVYCCPLIRADNTTAVVFFGGDVQDFEENMETHRDNKKYVQWNLENTASLLQTKYPESHVVVVRPSRMELKTFSCYDNFVPCNDVGAPDHTPMHHSLRHLELLLKDISQRLRTMPPSELLQCKNGTEKVEVAGDESPFWWQKDLRLDEAKLTLIGFSKGCVVLNQFLYEFHYLKTLTPDDDSLTTLVDQIQDMYWLDGGHAGGKNTWITSRNLVETLSRLCINIHIHVTPYQINDDRRPWIRREEKAFSDLLRRLGAPVNRTVHFEHEHASLCIHFDILSVFHQAE